MLKIKSKMEFSSEDIPKVVFDQNFNLLFMSRSKIPLTALIMHTNKFVYMYSLETL